MIDTDLINTLPQFGEKQSTDKEARNLIKQGIKAFDLAEGDRKFGSNASAFQNAAEPAIAISSWHIEQGLWRYREAIVKFEQARRLSLSPLFKKYVDLKITECIKNAKICRSLQKRRITKDLCN
jgi:hypothetical protein